MDHNGDLTIRGFVDLLENELRNARLQNLAAAPAGPVIGQVYHDTILDAPRFYTSLGWITVGEGGITLADSPLEITGDTISLIVDAAGGVASFAALGAEIAARGNADTTLATAITNEASTRATAVSNEATARATAVSNEVTARAAADTALSGSLAAETARATAVENAKADLVGGLVPTSQIPPLAITSSTPVASQAAMLALTAQNGDVAVRTDLGRSFILSGNDPTVLANWLPLSSADAVASVNGQVGAVVLSAANVGAPTVGDLTTEATVRANADTALGLEIDTEVTARTDADVAEVISRDQAIADAVAGIDPNLSDENPQPLGTNGPGIGTKAARDDHDHGMPEIDIGGGPTPLDEAVRDQVVPYVTGAWEYAADFNADREADIAAIGIDKDTPERAEQNWRNWYAPIMNDHDLTATVGGPNFAQLAVTDGYVPVNTTDGPFEVALWKHDGIPRHVYISNNGPNLLTVRAHDDEGGAGFFERIVQPGEKILILPSGALWTVNEIVPDHPDAVDDYVLVSIGGVDTWVARDLFDAPLISHIFSVNSEAEMLALPANQGDFAVRVDGTPWSETDSPGQRTFALHADDPTILGHWTPILTTSWGDGQLQAVEGTNPRVPPSPVGATDGLVVKTLGEVFVLAPESGGGSGVVETIAEGDNVTVDATDPANPIVGVPSVPAADVTGLATVATSGDYDDLTDKPTTMTPTDDSVSTVKIQNATVTLAKQADLAEARIVGRAVGAGAGAPTALTEAQTLAIAKAGASGTKNSTTFLRGDDTYAAPSGIANTIIDAKGDLIVGTSPDTSARKAIGTDFSVLTADSSQGDGMAWLRPAFFGLWPSTLTAGWYLTPYSANARVTAYTSGTGTANSASFVDLAPIVVPTALTIDQMAINLTTAATDSGATIELAFGYLSGANWVELWSAGTASVTGSPALITISTSHAVTPGIYYAALKLVTTTTAGTNPVFSGSRLALNPSLVSTSSALSGSNFLTVIRSTGGLGSSASIPGSRAVTLNPGVTSDVPMIGCRIA